jgi:hypothetical protein
VTLLAVDYELLRDLLFAVDANSSAVLGGTVLPEER